MTDHATETGQGSHDDELIERLRVVWQSYLTGPDTAQGLGKLNKAAFMGERMGRVLDHIAAQTQRIQTLEEALAACKKQVTGLIRLNNENAEIGARHIKNGEISLSLAIEVLDKWGRTEKLVKELKAELMRRDASKEATDAHE